MEKKYKNFHDDDAVADSDDVFKDNAVDDG